MAQMRNVEHADRTQRPRSASGATETELRSTTEAVAKRLGKAARGGAGRLQIEIPSFSRRPSEASTGSPRSRSSTIDLAYGGDQAQRDHAEILDRVARAARRLRTSTGTKYRPTES